MTRPEFDTALEWLDDPALYSEEPGVAEYLGCFMNYPRLRELLEEAERITYVPTSLPGLTWQFVRANDDTE